MFIIYLHQRYNNQEVIKNIKIWQGINLEWLLLLFVHQYRSILYWKIDDKDIADATKFLKKLMRFFLAWSINRYFCQNTILIRGEKSIIGPINEKKSWNRNRIRKILLTVIVADSRQFTMKKQPFLYTRVFIELDNWKNHREMD